MQNSEKLRRLAAWHGEFAEKTENPVIWDARLRMAQDLEFEAAQLDRQRTPSEI